MLGGEINPGGLGAEPPAWSRITVKEVTTAMARRRKWQKPTEGEKEIKRGLLKLRADPNADVPDVLKTLTRRERRFLIKIIRLRPGPGKAYPHKASCGCARCTKQNPRLWER